MKQNKMKILDEIINLMDHEDGKRLAKHPKLVAAKVTIAKPVDKEEMKKDAEMEGEDMMHEMEEPQALDPIEDLLEGLDEDKKAKIRALIK